MLFLERACGRLAWPLWRVWPALLTPLDPCALNASLPPPAAGPREGRDRHRPPPPPEPDRHLQWGRPAEALEALRACSCQLLAWRLLCSSYPAVLPPPCLFFMSIFFKLQWLQRRAARAFTCCSVLQPPQCPKRVEGTLSFFTAPLSSSPGLLFSCWEWNERKRRSVAHGWRWVWDAGRCEESSRVLAARETVVLNNSTSFCK